MKMKPIRLFVTVVALLLSATMQCFAPNNTVTSRVLSPYITAMSAQSQGAITGLDSLPAGSGTGIKLASVQHGVTVPFDPSSGTATGNPKHSLFTIVKQLDSNTPKFYKALVNNENISQMVIRFYGTTSLGGNVAIFTYTLTNVRITAIRNWQPNANDPAATPYAHPEEVSFSYGSITWRDELNGAEFTTTANTGGI